jgi:ribonuclease HI
MGLQIAQSRNIHTLTVLGDSEIVIRDLLGHSTSTTQISIGLHSRIKTLKQKFTKIHFFHILHSQNHEADRLAKSIKTLEQGQLFIIQDLSHAWIP